MRGIPSAFILFFFAFVLIIELVSFWALLLFLQKSEKKLRILISLIYALISFSVTMLLIFAFANPESLRQSRDYTFFFAVILIGFINIIPKTLITIVTFVTYLIHRLTGKKFQLLVLTGSFILSIGICSTILYGVLIGRYWIRVEEQSISLNELPAQLDGLRIVQLSDIHLGSFDKNQAVFRKTIEIINDLKPDLLLFTGDMVNNFASEFLGFESDLKQLQAKYGKYGIVGNHDYGDYSDWPDSISKMQNLKGIRDAIELAGFKLLLNQWMKIEIMDTSFYLIGVENWGKPPFKQYAHLNAAMNSIPENSFKMLLSHDPAHWEAKVVQQTNIPLTLSGHTHGAQIGIKIAGIEFSPIYLNQKKWGGLYKIGNQYLFVNRGLGTIGYPGRIDMRPEITLIILQRSKNH